MYLDDALSDPSYWLEGAEAHRLLRVLRLGPGAALCLFNGRGRTLPVSISTADKRRVLLEARGRPVDDPPPPCRITLFQSLIKGPRMDWLVEKCVELGASRLAPVLTTRTVSRVDAAGNGAHKRARWAKIAMEAARQCGTAWLPEIDAPATLERVLNEWTPMEAPLLVGSLMPETTPLPEALPPRPPRHIGVLIGPEGDFAPAELAAACRAGARPVSFGPRILRAETAALFALSVLSAHWRH